MTTTLGPDERIHAAKDVDAKVPATFASKAVGKAGARIRDVRTAIRRTAPPLSWAARHAWYGLVGTAKCTRGVWRWLTAAEYEAHRAEKPELVERTRARRRKALGYTCVPVLAAYSATAWIYYPWPIIAAGILVLAGFATAAKVEKTLRQAAFDEVRKKAGKLPGSRAVRQACADAKLGECRIVGAVTRTQQDDAWVAIIERPAGEPASKALAKKEELASALGVAIELLDLTLISEHAGRFKITCFDRDPLQGAPIPTPLLNKQQVDLWTESIPIGVDLRGRVVTVSLPERSMLLGGEPGAGKSIAAMNILLAVALDPHAQLWLGDGKGVDTLDLEPLAHKVAPSADPAGLLKLLKELQKEMDRRFLELRKLGRKKIEPGMDGMPLIVLWIDELARYTRDKKHKDEISETLRDTISRGRAGGIITICATQKPAATVVPTDIRDLLSIRDALRCTTKAASDTILGDGWASAGYSAKSITAAQRGVGLLLDEGSTPVKLRHFMVDPAGEKRLIERAYLLRSAAGTLLLPEDHPRRKKMIQILEAIGEADRISTEVLLERLGDEWTAQMLSEVLGLSGYPKPLWIDGRTKQGYEREPIQEALDAL